MLVILTILGWGVGSVFYKIANDNIHPIMVSTIVTIVYCIFTPFSFLLLKFPREVNSSGLLFSILGGLMMAVGSLAYMFALKRGGAGEVTTITALYPALTLMLSIIFLQEDLTFKKGVGVILALFSFWFLTKK